jgi:hypothetical protein
MNIRVKRLEPFFVPRSASSVTPAVSRDRQSIRLEILCKGFFKKSFDERGGMTLKISQLLQISLEYGVFTGF